MKTKNLKLKTEKTQSSEEFENMKNQLARAMADYSNLQKRTEEERKSMYKLASISFMTKILPIIDNLKNAQNHVKDSGIAMIIGQLESLAKEEGFEEIKLNTGDLFNEATSEAVEVLETNEEKDNNRIEKVLVSGWKYSDGTVVRHAKVNVFKYTTKTEKDINTNIKEDNK